MTTLAEAAADAYLAGWALTGAPFTGRITAGCAAAASCALDHPRDPAVLEATLDLGHLEGTWALIYTRRERLLAKHLRAVLAAWKACTTGLDPGELARQVHATAAQHAETSTPERQWWQDTATATALTWLRGVYQADGYQALVAAVTAAIRAGMAEGEADALALAASRQGRAGFQIGQAFTAAFTRLADDPATAQQAADTAAAMIDGTAASIGSRLAQAAADAASADDMTAAIQDALDGQQAPHRWTDWALWAGIGAGTTALYRKLAGLVRVTVKVDWLTAGDDRVCPACQANEDGSPYVLDTLPALPAHPGCRCSTQARTRFPLSLLAPFLSSP